MDALRLVKLRQIGTVVVDERDVKLRFQRQRHAAAGAAEAEIVLIRLHAALNDGDQIALVRHLRHGETFLDAHGALAGLLLELTVEVQPEAGVDRVVAVAAHRAAHARAHSDVGCVTDDVLRHLDRDDDGVRVDVAVVQLQTLADHRADDRLHRELTHHVRKAHHVHGILQVLFQEVRAELCVAVIQRDPVDLHLAGGVAVGAFHFGCHVVVPLSKLFRPVEFACNLSVACCVRKR